MSRPRNRRRLKFVALVVVRQNDGVVFLFQAFLGGYSWLPTEGRALLIALDMCAYCTYPLVQVEFFSLATSSASD